MGIINKIDLTVATLTMGMLDRAMCSGLLRILMV